MNNKERERNDLLEEIELKFNDFLAQEMKDYDSKIEMKIAVAKYFSDEVQKYSIDELKEKLKDSKSLLNSFSEFLKEAECIVC